LKEPSDERPIIEDSPLLSSTEPKLRKKESSSDNLQERMIKMEAELTALREELSSRSSKTSSSNNPSMDEAQTNSTLPNGKEDTIEEKESVDINSETNHSNDTKEEEQN